MQSVCELHSFRKAMQDYGMEEEELSSLVDALAENPKLGDEIPGTGGCRKLRWRRKDIGKSGGYRIITFFSGEAMPVYLLTLFAKGDKTDLTERERANLKDLTDQIVKAHQRVITRGAKQKDE